MSAPAVRNRKRTCTCPNENNYRANSVCPICNDYQPSLDDSQSDEPATKKVKTDRDQQLRSSNSNTPSEAARQLFQDHATFIAVPHALLPSDGISHGASSFETDHSSSLHGSHDRRTGAAIGEQCQFPKCSTHHLPMNFWCKSCTVFCCHVCSEYGKHKGHVTPLVETLAGDARFKLTKLVREMEAEQPWFASEVSFLAKLVHDRLPRSRKQVVETIEEKVAQLMERIKQKHRELLEQLETYYTASRKQADLRLESLALCRSQATGALEECREFAAASDHRVLQSLGGIVQRHQEAVTAIGKYKNEPQLAGAVKIDGLKVFGHCSFEEIKFSEIKLTSVFNGSAKNLLELPIEDRESLVIAKFESDEFNFDVESPGVDVSSNASSIADAIKQNKSLMSVNLDYNEIGDDGALVIAGAIKQNENLTSVDLSDNRIGVSGAFFIAEAIKEHKSLTSVNLSNNQIGASGASLIAGAIEENKSLTSVDLSNNQIGDDGASVIAKRFGQNESLTSVNLSDNQIGASGASSIVEAIKQNKSLTSVNLSSNRIGNAGAFVIAKALGQNMKLMSVNLGYNQTWVSESGASVIISEGFGQNKSLTSVDLSSNQIDASGASAIAEAIKQIQA